jgi:hypothetical protein
MNYANIQEKYAAEFKEFLKEKLNKIRQEQADIEILLSGNQPVTLNNNTGTEPNLSGYKPVWTWKQKIIYILGKKDLTTTEIVNKIIENEPNLENQRSKVVGTVSAILSSCSKKTTDMFGKYQNDRGLYVYKLNKNE